MRYARLTVTGAEQTNPAGAARIYEFEAYSPEVGVDGNPLAPVTAYSGLGATGRAQGFEVGAYDATRGNLGLVGTAATRSLDVRAGYAATLCRGTGLLDCTSLAAGRHTLLPAGFDLAVRSLRVARTP